MEIGFIQPDFTDEESKDIHNELIKVFETIDFHISKPNKLAERISARHARNPNFHRYKYDLNLIEIVKGIADKYNVLYSYLSDEVVFIVEFRKGIIDNTKCEDNE